jgi:hypothetical protein
MMPRLEQISPWKMSLQTPPLAAVDDSNIDTSTRLHLRLRVQLQVAVMNWIPDMLRKPKYQENGTLCIY